MLKLRLRKIGRKGSPSYRIVIMENTMRRDGRAIDELGFYNPISKQFYIDQNKVKKWLKEGAKPTNTINNLIRQLDSTKN